ncbi:hypothetical protein M409DRAFT_52928 [Zasmidium cellare ATCC 36951]|uniref:RING-type domain-containing protein n=1 Tax=Zasmidium cellare ATCC 36951 TaxID=1080233 RepID=A0A6A6CQI5_ZASCE|nr:uncharacterized protein M409DRAFT_52928 [Zasmidium cellare ATCC 36951]KAF2168943.1 hypothetical protein M409DRAFT_52928 [Zasmidium cellare ATCC 36951]
MPSDDGQHTAEGSSRKRLKISRDDSRPAGMSQPADLKPATSPAKPRTAVKVENDLHTNGTPCHHEQAFRSLNDNLDTMRQLITCRICQRFLYEPYALTCGHTFCYSCLSQWLGQNRKKTCPDCRTVIKQQPSPSYLVREMVLVFLSKSELLPDGETSEEHSQYAKEEADIVAKDKANTDARTGGLFKGSFNPGRLMPLIAIRDASDNVDRCPQCLHEVEDGRCNTCDVRVRGQDDDLDWSDEDSDESDDLDHDLDAEDHDFPLAFDYPEGYMYDPDDFDDDLDDFDYGYGPPPPFIPSDGPVSDVSDEESDEEDDPSMNGFIDDGSNHQHDESSDINGDSDGTEVETVHPPSRARRAMPIVDSDDDEEDDDEAEPIQPRRRRVVVVQAPSRRTSEAPSSAGADPTVISDDDDDDDEGPVTASQRSRGARRVNLRLDDDDDDSDNETETTTRSAYGGFSPPQYDLTGDTDDEEHEDEHDYHDHYDGQSATSGATEQSMVQYGSDNGEDDDSEDDGWGSDLPSVLFQDHVLTRAADTPADTRMPSCDPSHRLATLGSRRSRHADPPSDSPPSYDDLFSNIPTSSYTRHLQPQDPPRRTLHVTRQHAGTSQ